LDKIQHGPHEQLSAGSLIARLQQRIDEAVRFDIPMSRTYSLLDFPDYSNVGDTLIWLGANKFLRDKFGCGPSYTATARGFDPDALRELAPEGPIFLSGGGNFGDLWPHFQAFRLSVLRNFPDRQVIQLPQTIHFESTEGAVATQQAISEHSNFLLLVRDKPSQDFAQDVMGCDAILCPDMAFALGPLTPTREATHDIAVMLRTDKEGNGNLLNFQAPATMSVTSFDWIHNEQLPFSARFFGRTHRHTGWPSSKWLQERRAKFRLSRGIALLSQGRTLLTDRLHGHILAILLGMPNAVLDNSYGKLRNFHLMWTKDFVDASFHADVVQALEWVERRQIQYNPGS